MASRAPAEQEALDSILSTEEEGQKSPEEILRCRREKRGVRSVSKMHALSHLCCTAHSPGFRATAGAAHKPGCG